MNEIEDAEAVEGPVEWYLLESEQSFGDSLIWHMNRRYYEVTGVDAWRREEIPHFVTDNVSIADSYADLIFGLWADRRRIAHAAGLPLEPLHICELGSGSGRFAYHLLRRLAARCRATGIPLSSFRYILTDQAGANTRWWTQHPHLQPFLAEGIVDIAGFDIRESQTLTTSVRGDNLGPGALDEPLVVIANYVFDSVPQELYYACGGTLESCHISLAVDQDPDRLTDRELIDRLTWHYGRPAAPSDPALEPWLLDLLLPYREALSETYLLFPAAAIRCLERLRSWSRSGMLLLSADKGTHRLNDLEGMPSPDLIRHGACFSFNVNYHAIAAYTTQRGGLARFSERPHQSIDIACCLLADEPSTYTETWRAFRQQQDFGPDEFFEVSRAAWKVASDLTVEAILGHIRLGRHDSQVLAQFLPALLDRAPSIPRHVGDMLVDAVDATWETYFPLGEPFDLAFEIARLMYALEQYERAAVYFGRSLEIYGPDDGTAANLELCKAAQRELSPGTAGR
jgi:tetratricopeptide (TPR) repeat protein